MFTGLIHQRGTILAMNRHAAFHRLSLACDPWASTVLDGESICVAGCCLSVVASSGALEVIFDVVPETLGATTLGTLCAGDQVNLERSMQAGDLLGGHMVQGHVEAVEEVLAVLEDEDGHVVRISMTTVDSDAVVPKGSITVDGVSLTVASVSDGDFTVALIPMTLQDTTLGALRCGDRVNLETDIVARSVAHVVRRMSGGPGV